MLPGLTPRASLVAVGLLAGSGLMGCSNMLGLDGLTYDRQDVHAGAAGSGSSAGIPLPIGKTPDGEALTDWNEFPVVWAPDTLIAAGPGETGSSSYWGLEPSGDLHVRVSLAHGRFFSESRVESNWSSMVTVPTDEGLFLRGYDAETGMTDFGPAPTTDAPFEGRRFSGTPGWTDQIRIEGQTEPLVLYYSRETGDFRLGPAVPEVQYPRIIRSTWSAGFDAILPFAVEGTIGFLRLDRQELETETVHDTKETRVDFVPLLSTLDDAQHEVLELGTPLELGSFDMPWTLTIPRWTDAPTGDAVVYDADTGQACIGGFFDTGLVVSECVYWREGITSLIPVIAPSGWSGDWSQVLAYSADTGVLDLYRLGQLEQAIIK